MHNATDTKWKLATAFFTCITVLAITFTAWNERQPRPIEPSAEKLNLDPGKPPDPSVATTASLKLFVDNRDWIAGISIDRILFVQNVRETTFSYFKNNDVQERWPTQSVLFGPEELINQIIVDLLNGQMACLAVADAVTEEVLAILKDDVATMCMVRIPPSRGGFAGFVTIYLSQPPTPAEFKRLVTNAQRLADEIYGRDIAQQIK